MAGTANAVNGPEAAPYLAKTGGTISGTLTLTPASQTGENDAATIGMIQAKNLKDPCAASSTTGFTVTYNNGASGVGATLTNAGAQAAFATDGYSASVGDRILIKNQSSSFQNGIYAVTTLGSGATNWVLTRTTDMNNPGDFKNATTLILNGSTLANTTWTETLTVTTIGTDPVTFVQTGSGTSGTVTSVGSGTGLTGGPITSTGSLSFAAIAANSLWANVTGGSAVPTVIGTNTFLQSVNIQLITANATYTPTTGMRYCIVEIVGGGGGSGGATGDTAQGSAGAGGGGGGYCRKFYSATSLGANAAVVIGAGGTAGTSAGGNGGNGASSTFTPAGAGAILTASGGQGGNGATASASMTFTVSNGSGGGTNGDINLAGGFGGYGMNFAGGTGGVTGLGGGTPFSQTNITIWATAAVGGTQGTGYGGGAYGAIANGNGITRAGGAGQNGVCLITEFIAV